MKHHESDMDDSPEIAILSSAYIAFFEVSIYPEMIDDFKPARKQKRWAQQGRIAEKTPIIAGENAALRERAMAASPDAAAFLSGAMTAMVEDEHVGTSIWEMLKR